MKAHIHETEARLLAALRIDPENVLEAVTDGLTAAHFTKPIHARIFTALCTITSKGEKTARKGQIIDEESIWLHVRDEISLFEMAQLMGRECSSLHCHRLTAEVIKQAKGRTVAALLSRAQQALSEDDPTIEWPELWEKAEPHLQKAHEAAARDKTRNRAAVIAEAKALLGPPDNSGLPGPFPLWDRAAGKLGPGQLCVLGGRPGDGKSALALQWATACVKSDKSVSLFTLEMSESEILSRLARQKARSDITSESEPLVDVVARMPYKIYDAGAATTIAQIESRAKLDAASGNLGLIIVDYVGLVTPPADMKSVSREQQVASLSRRFKLLAGELRCPVLLLSQLSRECEKDGREPRLSDLRESGALEQDADAVWFLHKDNPEDGGETVVVKLVQRKRRNGRPCFVRLGFTGRILTFAPLG